MKRPPEIAAASGISSPEVPSGPAAKPGRRAVRRDRVRAELIEIGLDLFKKKGFEETTVNDIVDFAGLSPRTFFRYFKSKDDIVFDWIDRQGEFIRPLLSARPQSEPPLQAMEQSFLQLAAYHDANRRFSTFLNHLVFDTPSLSGRYHSEQAKWEGEFIGILLRARAVPAGEIFALRVQVATAITAFVTAVRAWAAEPRSTTLSPLVSAAFATLNAAAAIPLVLSDAPSSKRGTNRR